MLNELHSRMLIRRDNLLRWLDESRAPSLGHKKIEITLNIYAHVLPSMGKDAAARISSILR